MLVCSRIIDFVESSKEFLAYRENENKEGGKAISFNKPLVNLRTSKVNTSMALYCKLLLACPLVLNALSFTFVLCLPKFTQHYKQN